MFGGRLSDDLKALLGDAGFLALVEAFGGTRLYVTGKPDADHQITEALGERGATLLARRYSPAIIRVPLAREERARHYRAAGDSNARIARRLGMTEPGVEQMFARMENPPVKGSKPLPLFDI